MQGSSSGDFVWKAFPKEIAARADDWRVSGLRVGFRVDKSYTGSLPNFVLLPRVIFYPLVEATIEGKVFDVPDFTKPFPQTFQLGGWRVTRAEPQTFELRLGPQQPDPRLRSPVVLPARDAGGNPQGWAVALQAPFGARLGNGQANFVAVPSFGEIHRAFSRTSHSGLRDGTTNKILPFGTTGAPSNLGELAIDLYFDDATLQVFSDASGGLRKDKNAVETHKGPGAYDNALASAASPGWFGLYVQHEMKTGLVCLPIVVSSSSKLPSRALAVDAANLLIDPTGLGLTTLFTEVGVFGSLGLYKAGGDAGHRRDQAGVWQSGRLGFPVDPRLAGLAFWCQALLVDVQSRRSVTATNAVRLRF